ncbi:MAG: RidA family protein [Rhizobiaceae bacterium]|nr:RidA family protein [Rhizobiaceae bacterium]
MLHGPHLAHQPLLSVVVHGGVAHVSGQLPRVDGRIVCLGQVGVDVDVAEATAAAEICALNALAVLEQALGDLDRIERFLRVTGFVASSPDFAEHPAVIDGASKLFHLVFGEAGRHVRSAIGVASLPRGAAVEIELSVAISS